MILSPETFEHDGQTRRWQRSQILHLVLIVQNEKLIFPFYFADSTTKRPRSSSDDEVWVTFVLFVVVRTNAL